jgi:hypothetical protein
VFECACYRVAEDITSEALNYPMANVDVSTHVEHSTNPVVIREWG